MSDNVNSASKWAKACAIAVGVGIVALPLSGALATGEDPAQANLSSEQMDASRALFNQHSCGACHVLDAADGSGQIGPQLDGNANLDHDTIVNVVTNGQGGMPGYGGMIDEADIAQLATYIIAVKK